MGRDESLWCWIVAKLGGVTAFLAVLSCRLQLYFHINIVVFMPEACSRAPGSIHGQLYPHNVFGPVDCKNGLTPLSNHQAHKVALQGANIVGMSGTDKNVGCLRGGVWSQQSKILTLPAKLDIIANTWRHS